MVYLSVDPGFNTGVAIWDTRKLSSVPVATLTISYPSMKGKDAWKVKAGAIARDFKHLLAKWSVNQVWCEWPEFWGSGVGLISARSGDLVKLTFMVGVVAGACYSYDVEFHPVPVSRWKGQLPKQAVIKRIKRITGIEYKSHVADAVGIGLWKKGLL